jgi:hypothetical protein
LLTKVNVENPLVLKYRDAGNKAAAKLLFVAGIQSLKLAYCGMAYQKKDKKGLYPHVLRIISTGNVVLKLFSYLRSKGHD